MNQELKLAPEEAAALEAFEAERDRQILLRYAKVEALLVEAERLQDWAIRTRDIRKALWGPL